MSIREAAKRVPGRATYTSSRKWHTGHGMPVSAAGTAEEVFGNLRAGQFALSEQQREQSRDELWRSVCSEHDARHFHRHLNTVISDVPWRVQEFLVRWLADEYNHARGFKMLFGTLYDIDLDSIEAALAQRQISFDHLEEFFSDIESAALLLAYDELVTVHVYRYSVPFYDSLGARTPGPRWIRQLIRDEARHFRGIMNFLQTTRLDAHRAAAVLQRIVDADVAQSAYSGTFVLDHTCPEFPFSRSDLLGMCHRAIVERFARRSFR
jgi:hypothetical protein